MTLNALISDKHQLVYVLVKKCASTTMHQVFLDISKVPQIEGDHLDWYKPDRIDHLQDYGLRRNYLSVEQAIEFQRQKPNYAWITVVRNPFKRALSNYFNKMNVFCKTHYPSIYLYGKYRKLMRGPAGWRCNQHSLTAMRTRLSFEEMLQTLAERGIDFDNHFTLQSDHIGYGKISYDHLLRVENLDQQLPKLLADYGLNHPKEEEPATIPFVPRKNSSCYQSDRDEYFTKEATRLIQQLYAEDFANFGYDTQYHVPKLTTPMPTLHRAA